MPRNILGKQSCVGELFGLCLQNWGFVKGLVLGGGGEVENKIAELFGPEGGGARVGLGEKDRGGGNRGGERESGLSVLGEVVWILEREERCEREELFSGEREMTK
ncbi:hypothetical protein ACFX13_044811 [Malus domestica]